MQSRNRDDSITQRVVELFVAGRGFETDDRGNRWTSQKVHTTCERFLEQRSKETLPAPQSYHTDFAAAFVDGQTYIADDGRIVRMRVREVEHLTVTSGRLEGCDPGYGSGQKAFERTIPKGRYPVVLALANRTVACAMVRIREVEPVRWEMALKQGQNLAELDGDRFFGYGVDGGEGCFLDADQDRFLDDVQQQRLIERRSRTATDPFQGRWGARTLDPLTGGNVIAFQSGYGDGAYPSYWGLDEQGDAVCLVTDFLVLVAHPKIEFFVPAIFSRPAGPVPHRALDVAGLTMEVVPGRVPQRSVVVGFVGRKAMSAEVHVRTEFAEPAEMLDSDLSVSQESDHFDFVCQEYVLAPSVADEFRDRLGIQVRLSLNVTPLQPLGVTAAPDDVERLAGCGPATSVDQDAGAPAADSVVAYGASRGVVLRPESARGIAAFLYDAMPSLSRRSFFVYSIPLSVGLISNWERLWPSYVPDWFGQAACVMLFIPFVAERIIPSFGRWSREVAGLCYLILAAMAIANGLEERNFTTVGYGAFIGLLAILIVWEDAIRDGSYRGIPGRNLFFAATFAIVGFIGAVEPWILEEARIAIPLAAAATCVAFLFRHDALRYCGAGLCLLIATAMGYQSIANPAWLPVCLWMPMGAYAFLRGDIEAKENPETEPDE